MKYLRAQSFCAVLLGLWLLAGPGALDASAQPRPVRSGLWLEVGAGTGGLWLGCSTCEEPVAAYGESTYLRGGGAFSDRVLWGLEVFTLLSGTFEAPEEEGAPGAGRAPEVGTVSVAPVVLWYPWGGGAFVKGGVGISRGVVRVPAAAQGAETLRASNTGSGLTFGAGFDVPVLSWLALTTNVGVYYGAIGDLSVQDAYVDDIITTVYNVNFSLTLR